MADVRELRRMVEENRVDEEKAAFSELMQSAITKSGMFDDRLKLLKAGLELPASICHIYDYGDRGKGKGRPFAFFETSDGTMNMLSRNGAALPAGYRKVTVGARRFFVHEGILPTLETLKRPGAKIVRPKGAKKGEKRTGSRVADSALAAKIEVAILDAIVIAVLVDALAAQKIVARAKVLLQEAQSTHGKRSRPALVHPSVVATAEATLGAPPRDIDYEPIIAQMVDEAAERVRQSQLRKLA